MSGSTQASVIQRNYRVRMICKRLDLVPEYAIPSPYSIRHYQSGDEEGWLRIQALADHHNAITPSLFYGQFGDSIPVLEERQLYLLNEEAKTIGTATAWFDNDFDGERIGRVHWVAIEPTYQGKGLAKPLMTAVCHRLKELGHGSAYLTTSTARITAINLYLKFGFTPIIKSSDDLQIWQELSAHLKEPIIFK